MKYKTITIKIPVPVPAFTAWKSIAYRFKKIKFQLFPFRCSVCRTAVNVRHPMYSTGSLLIENSKRETICRACLAEALKTNEWEPRFTHTLGIPKDKGTYKRYWSAASCDACGAKRESYKDVEVSTSISVLFCLQAWNYNYICKPCVIGAIETGRVTTSAIASSYNVNEVGLRIGKNGELL